VGVDGWIRILSVGVWEEIKKEKRKEERKDKRERGKREKRKYFARKGNLTIEREKKRERHYRHFTLLSILHS
jgi:hypothetical protein